MTLKDEVLKKQDRARELLRDADDRWITCHQLSIGSSFSENLGKLIQCSDLSNLERIANSFYDEVITAYRSGLDYLEQQLKGK